MKERIIGKVISVDSFRVYIRLDDELKSLYKSGYEDIYEVARINSYVIIPVGSDKIVAMVTSVKSIDETELNKDRESIFLTKPSRYLVATMVGTISNDKYIQGVYNYPILDNPIWYITKNDLDKIFDQHSGRVIDYNEDYYLPIGTSPAFKDYEVKINPDKLFGKHAAILGNTGSGKSCTLTSILQSLFSFDYNGNKLRSSHIIIFDTNGEYAQAFQGTESNPSSLLKQINPFVINKDGLKVPYWFMNYDDYEYLFEPTAATQTPIFKRALSLAKMTSCEKVEKCLDNYTERFIYYLLECSPNDINRLKSYTEWGKKIYDAKNRILDVCNSIPDKVSDRIDKIKAQLLTLGRECSFEEERDSLQSLESFFNEYKELRQESKISESKNIDLPLWYSFEELLAKFMDEAITEQDINNNKLREFVSTLRLRLHSYLNDERIAGPLMLNKQSEIEYSLAKFIAFVLGDFSKVYHTANPDIFTRNYMSKSSTVHPKLDKSKSSQITIIDMSLLPYEVLETITGLIGRLILEFVSRFPEDKRAAMPLVLVLEEAQNYIPEKNRGDRESISKKVFERIAREGRKYGVSLVVSSQRPSELSKTVLSQCNSFIIHRLQNPEDQNYVRQLVSAANEDILRQLPILPQQHVVILGDAVKTPVQARMRTANPRPNSNNPEFVNKWLNDSKITPEDYKSVTEAWEKGESCSLKVEEKVEE